MLRKFVKERPNALERRAEDCLPREAMAKKSTAVVSRKAFFTAILAITLGTLTSGKWLLLLLFFFTSLLCAVLSFSIFFLYFALF